MGLFDKRDKKRKSDDFDSPVEKIDLSAPTSSEPEREITAEPPPADEPAAKPAPAAAAPAPARPAPSPALDDDDDGEYDSSFGIQKAIELMRTLPQDNVELVVQVVKLTLESTRIKISHIIDDATRKEEDIQGRIKVLKEEIADFEKEIAQRKEEISGLEADHEETAMVKDRLQLAEKLTKKQAAAAAAGGGSAPAGSSPAASSPGAASSKLPGPGTKRVSSDGKDKAGASGTIGSGSGSRPSVGSQTGKHSVVVKK